MKAAIRSAGDGATTAADACSRSCGAARTGQSGRDGWWLSRRRRRRLARWSRRSRRSRGSGACASWQAI